VDGVLQADSGLMSLIGLPGNEPCKVQAPVVDVTTGYIACTGILARLAERHATGRGGHVDVNLFNSALALQQSSLTSFFADGQSPVRSGSAAPYAAPNQAFETVDGWIMVAAYMPDRWTRLCALLGLPSLATDARFATSPLRVANRAAMTELLTAVFRQRSADAWMDVLQAADILCAKVAQYEDVARHPQLRSNAMLASVDVPGIGPVRMPGFPINSGPSNAQGFRPAPSLGQHTHTVLRELGYDHDDIAQLAESGAVHCAREADAAHHRSPEPQALAD
jgi:crotonobetainyl-CoA:carnitine CoA-transferase CaiB-like acyl-CoA transferase